MVFGLGLYAAWTTCGSNNAVLPFGSCRRHIVGQRA